MARYITAASQLASMPAYSSGSWQPLGPATRAGRITALVASPADAATLYAASAWGVWKTTDSGATWGRAGDFPGYLAASSLAIDPSNPATVYAGTGSSNYKGAASPGVGIYRTTDSGSTWTLLPSTTGASFTYINDLVISLNAGSAVYAATATGVWQSLDSGASWTQSLATTVTGGCLDLATRTDIGTDVVLASCGTFEQATVYRNVDAAGSGAWATVLTEPGMGRTSLAVAPSNQSVMYALSASVAPGKYQHGLHAVFRSTDGGATWAAQVRNTDATKLNTLLLTNVPNATYSDCSLGSISSFYNQGWYDNVIAVDPADPDRVWVGGIDLFRSDDGGANWGLASYWWASETAERYAHADHHAIVFAPGYDGSSSKRLFVATDGGVFRTDDARAATASGVLAGGAACDSSSGATVWTSVNAGLTPIELQAGAVSADGSSYFAAARDEGILRGTDVAGVSGWTRVLGGDGGSVAVDQSDANVVYSSAVGLAIAKSTDAGATFAAAATGISDAGLFVSPLVLDPGDKQTLWTGGAFLWRTIDGAASWTRGSAALPSVGSAISAIAVAPDNRNRVIAGTSTGFIVRSDAALSAGDQSTWSSVQPRAGFVSSIAFDPTESNTVYATYSTFGGAHVWKSTDAGASWAAADGRGYSTIPDVPVNSVVVDPLHPSRLYLGTDLGLFVSTDASASWAVESGGFGRVPVASLVMHGSTLFAFTQGGGVWKVIIGSGAGPLATVAFATATTSSPENVLPVHVAVQLVTIDGAATSFDISVDYATANGTATAADYTPASGTLTFPSGTASGTTQTIDVAVIDDGVDEPNETFTVTLGNPRAATLGATTTHTVTIVDDDVPAILIDDVTVVEPDAGSVNAVFTVSLSGPDAAATTVSYQTVAGTATAGQDYITTSGTLTFAPGETSKAIAVSVLGDTVDEPNETFTLALSNPVNGTLAKATGVGIIVDNDPPVIRIGDVNVVEGDSGSAPAVFTVRLSGPDASPTIVSYHTADVTATAGKDYVAAAGTLTFAPGETSKMVTVPVLGDTLDENTETFLVVLSDPVNGTLGRSVGSGFISDDDPATTANDEVLIFKENFDTDGAGFYNYGIDDGTLACIPGEPRPGAGIYGGASCRQYLPWVDGHIESHSPYWVDPNHKFDPGTPNPGIGFLNIVGFLWHGYRPLDLTNARLTFKMLLDTGFDLKGGHLSFWIQSACTSRPGFTCSFTFADYIIDTPIETLLTPGQWSEVTLIPHESDWKCLGGQAETASRYGCMPIADALARVENIGFMIVPVPIDPAGTNSVVAAVKIDDIHISRPTVQRARWTDLTDATANGGTVTRLPGTGWTAGAASSKVIESGDGFVEFTAVEADSARVLGLARQHSAPGYEQIDFGIGLTAAGALQVFESGALRGTFGSYAPSDRLRVEIESGVVRYRRNGVLQYTSDAAPVYPLGARAALFSSGATVGSASIAGRLAEHVEWTMGGGASSSGNSALGSVVDGSSAGAASLQSIPSGDGFIDVVVDDVGLTRMVGLSRSDSIQMESDIDFGLRFTSNGTLEIVEGGVSRGSFGGYAAGDRLQVGVEAGVVQYRRNGSLLYASAISPVYPLRAGLSSSGSTIADVLIRGTAEKVLWKNVVNLQATPGRLEKTSGSDWNAGASSTKGISSGDGFVEFTVTNAGTYPAIGLGHGDVGADPNEIDYAFLFDGSNILVMENGVLLPLGTLGTYSAGDRFRVAVEQGAVRYFHNGTLLYTSAVSPAYPLIADASLYSANTVLTDVVLGGYLEDYDPPAISIDNVAVVEGDVASVDAVFTVSLGAALAAPITVSYQTVDGTAKAGQDYVAASGSLTFAPGETSKTIVVSVLGDTLAEPNETFTVVLSEAIDGSLAVGTGTIVDDDPPAISIDDVTVTKPGTASAYAAFTVSLSFPSAGATSLSYQTVAGTAAAGRGYGTTSGTLTFAPGQTAKTITVPVLAHTMDDSIETFTVELSQPINGTLAKAIGAGHIVQQAWAQATGVAVSGRTVTKTGVDNWDAGSTSVKLIMSGDGFVDFRSAETNTNRIAGLTHRATATTFEDVDFAVMLTDNARVIIYEAGTLIGSPGSYATGDRFRVSVVGGGVRYWQNDRLLWTSTHTPQYPLRAATVLYSTGATVQDVVIVTPLDGALLNGDPSQPVAWTNAVRVSVSGNSLTKTSVGSWDAGASSAQAVLSGSGYMEFIATEDNTYRIAGLGKDDANVDLSNVDFGILLTAEQQVTIYESGEFRGMVGYYVPGDRFRVSVDSRVVRYWRNGSLLYTSTKPPSFPLLVDTSLFDFGSTVSAVTLGGNTAVDATIWAASVGVATTDTQIAKTGTDGWSSGAASKKAIRARDGFVEFIASETNTSRICGLGQRTAAATYEDVDFGIMLTGVGAVVIYEGTDYIGAFGPYVTGDRFRVSSAGGVVTYWRNTTLLYTSARTPGSPLHALAALFETGATIQGMRLIGTLDDAAWDAQAGEDVAWKAVVGASTSGTSLSKTVAAGWNAGAVSSKMIASGDGYIEVSAGGGSGSLIAGLSHNHTNQDYADVDFGLMLTSENQLLIHEAGLYRGKVGTYVPGDRVRVAVSDGIVRYWQNQRVIYTSTVPPAYPLFLDTALYSPGAVVGGGLIAGTLETEVTGWHDDFGVTTSDTSLTKTGAPGWNAGAVSKKSLLTGDGFVEFTASQTNASFIGGLTTRRHTTQFEDIDFGVLLTAEGSIAIYESGTYVGPYGAYVGGDRFRVAVVHGAVQYWHNGELLYTSVRTPTYPMQLGTVMFSAGATIGGLRLLSATDSAPWDAQVGEPVVWKTVVSASASANSLTKIVRGGWNGGGVSTKMIASGDGYVEFMASGIAGYRVGGLSNGDTNQDFADVDFGLMLTAEGQVLIYEAGQYRGLFGTYVSDDRFRVAVSAGVVRYWQNQQVIYTSTVPPVYPLHLDTSIFSPGAQIGQAQIAGALQTEPTGWNSAVGVSVSDSALTKTGVFGWNAGAVSKKSVPTGDAFVDFVVAETNTDRIAGFTRKSTSTAFEDLDFGVLLTANGVATIYESGTYMGGFGTYQKGDRFRVAITGGLVRYWRNDALLYTSARAVPYPLQIGTALYTPGATIGSLRFILGSDPAEWDAQLGEAVAWTQAVGVSAPDGSLTKWAVAGWNAGAASTKAIASGDGYVDFIATGASGYRIAGLSNGDTDQDFADVDFGILLTAEGRVLVTEGGRSCGPAGYYIAGDQFRVSVSGGVVRYWQNQQLIYTGTAPPKYPLLVDTALFSPTATITNVAIAGQF